MCDISFICNDCNKKFDLFDDFCPNCAGLEHEKETTELLEGNINHIIDFVEDKLREHIQDPGIHFIDQPEDGKNGYCMGSINKYDNKSREELFIEGFRFGLKESIDYIEYILDGWEYGNGSEFKRVRVKRP